MTSAPAPVAPPDPPGRTLPPRLTLRTIAPFVAAYLPEMTDLWVASWAKTMPAIDFEARRGWLVEHLSSLRERGVEIAVALVETGDIAGFVTVNPADGHLDQICVGVDWWGKGIAEALIAAARRISPARLHLDVNADNPRAVGFYRGQGFTETGRGANPRSGLPILMMEWTAATAETGAGRKTEPGNV